tara:strand:+ start:2790 stop:3032 length:243 start_codon:yes stop_codon:yes gene_type:complete
MKYKRIREILIEFGEDNNTFGTKDASNFLQNQRTRNGKKVRGFDVSSQVLGNLLASHKYFEKIERKRAETIWKYRGNKNE